MKGYPHLQVKLPPNWGWLLAIIAIILMLILNSCSPDFYCRKCPIKDSVYTSVHDTTIIRDTIIKVEERTLTVHDTVPCDNFEVNKDSNGVKIKIKVVNKVLTATASCAALEIKLRMYDKIRTIYHHKEQTRLVKSKAEKTGFQRFKDYWFWITISILVTILAMKILKTYAKFKLPF